MRQGAMDYALDANSGRWEAGAPPNSTWPRCRCRHLSEHRADSTRCANHKHDPGTGDCLMNITYPFHFDNLGRTARDSNDDHIRDMIEELLFTSPGERVNRPDFG